ncbi:hypothetical protein GQ44DRAFT_738106 [Phaeosphaeriaceae sp. PMI808]|nr:hypothetical protein GQ44DRAFT_738106 [Phaeosphaeriaceae sp. PMI808]
MGLPRKPLHSPTSPPMCGQALLDQLTLTRSTHIKSIIESHVLPIIETQASFGISTTTIALLPSDIPLSPIPEKSEFSFDTAEAKDGVEVIGFACEEEPKVVRLVGQINQTEFWRILAVIGELERVLREKLNESNSLAGLRRTGVRQPRRSFLSRMISESRASSKKSEVSTEQPEGDVGIVVVKARLEEICLRTANEFGLYDTMTKQCVIIKVDARC